MISIIVPIYNVDKFLSTTVESVLQQEDYSDWELILVDDGSKDGSPALCDQQAASDPRIKVIHKTNGGLSSARDAGIEASTGDYLLFLDGDDCLDSSTLRVLHQTAREHPDCDFIQFRYEEVLPAAPFGHKESCLTENYTEFYHEADFFQQLFDLGGVAASACTKFIKRVTLGDLRFQEGIIHEDEQFTTRLLARCRQVGYCTNEFYKYAIRSGSIQHSAFSMKRLDAISILDERIEYLRSKGYEHLVSLFQGRLFSNLLMMWTNAYEASNAEALAIIEQHLSRISKEKGVQLNGIETKLIHCLGKSVLKPLYSTRKLLKPFAQKLRNARTKWNNKRVISTRRKQLRSTDFTIISNNCWGGLVYQYFGLPYTSPTVDLFIMDDDYIKFLERLDYYLSLPLRFITNEQSRYHEHLASESTAKAYYPIARLDDIEIHFLHYHSEEEARTKWEYRKKRISKDRLLVKMSQRSANDRSLLDRFATLPFKNKICFTEFEHVGPEFVYIPELKYLNIQGGDETPYVMDKLDLVSLINKIDITQNTDKQLVNREVIYN